MSTLEPISFNQLARPRGLDLDVTLAKVLLNGNTLDVNIVGSLTDASIERTMDGASTVTLTVYDPERKLINSDLVDDRALITVDGLSFMRAAVSKAGTDLTFTFEDREVAILRRNRKPRKANRSQVTRAEFALSMVREVKNPVIKFFCPELHKVVPIAKSSQKVSATTRASNRQPGFDSGVTFTVKGIKATREQITNAERSLDVARTHNAPRLAHVALIMAEIQESGLRNLTGGDSSSVGILQLLNTWLGGSTSTSGGRRDVELVVKMFLENGFAGKGGAIALAQADPNKEPSVIATQVQGNARGAADYAPWKAEAEKIVALYYGGDGTYDPATDTTSSGATGKYEFRRGQPGQSESTWDALQRLASEVNWHCFMVEGTVYFVSDDYLMRSKPLMRITETSTGVDYIDFDIDSGKKVATCTVTARLSRWAAPPGSVVAVDGMGPADGRWLVQSVRRSLFSADGTVELRRAAPALLEPAQDQGSQSGGGGFSVGSANSVAGAKARIGSDGKALVPADAPEAVKKIIEAGNQIIGKPYSQEAPRTPNDKVLPHYDCSSAVAHALAGGGLVSPGLNITSVTLEGMFESGAGQWVTVYAASFHAYMEVAGIRLDTSSVGDTTNAGSGVRWRNAIGARSGFVTRHPKDL